MADAHSNPEKVLRADVGLSQVATLDEERQGNPVPVNLREVPVQDFLDLRQHFLRVAVQLIDARHLDDEEMEKWNMKKMEVCVGCNCLQESGCSVVLGVGCRRSVGAPSLMDYAVKVRAYLHRCPPPPVQGDVHAFRRPILRLARSEIIGGPKYLRSKDCQMV
jgi:hypothetical protein